MSKNIPDIPTVVVVDGITGSGKSTILEILRRHPANEAIATGRKLTTRPRRASDNDWEFTFTSQIEKNQSTLEWGSVGAQYAIATDDIYTHHQNGKAYAVICTDIPTIQNIKNNFTVLHIYVYRPINEIELLAILKERRTPEDAIASRLIEFKSQLADYTARLDSIDHVLLNAGTVEELQKQVMRIPQLSKIIDQRKPLAI